MKILVLENIPSSKRGGQELSLLDVCHGLAVKGHEIHLVYCETGDLFEKYKAFCKSTTKVHNYTINRNKLFSSSIGWLCSLAKALYIKADVIYANQYHDTFFGGALAQLKRLPLVCHLRLLPPGAFCGQWCLGMRAVTHFIAVSDATQNAYINAGIAPETITRVYNGIDLERFYMTDDREKTRKTINIPPDAFAIIYAGRIDRDKNLELLIEGFACFATSIPHALLLMAGSPHDHPSIEAGKQYQDELKALASKHSVKDRIQWLGHCSNLPELFRAVDASVLLTRSKEAFGRVLVESMACGTPAVGIRYGGIPEILSGEFQKFCVKNENPSELSATFKLLHDALKNDPGLRNRCRTHAQKNFPKETMIEGVENTLKQALAKKTFRLGPAFQKLRAWQNSVYQKQPLHICLISSVPLWTNPRLVKEADALVDAGHSITVITVVKTKESQERDLYLLKTKRWKAIHINLIRSEWQSKPRWLTSALRSELAAKAALFLPASSRLQEEGYFRGYNLVLQEALDCRANFYIAHTQGALPIAAHAAKQTGASFGFDCEDLLAEETADGLRSPAIRDTIIQIERRYLPQATYVSVTSEAMGEYLVQQYGIKSPIVIRNVFLKQDLHGIPPPNKRPSSNSIKLIWISTTIGSNRGIEDAVQALALLPASCELHLFGRITDQYRQELNQLTSSLDISSRLHIHDVIPNDEMMSTIASYDIGLTLDLKNCINRDLTIPNKLFLYLQCGLAVAATDTKGQREIMAKIPEAGFLHVPGDHRDLANKINSYAKDPDFLLKTKISAWNAGQEKYCWDGNRDVFLGNLDNLLQKKAIP